MIQKDRPLHCGLLHKRYIESRAQTYVQLVMQAAAGWILGLEQRMMQMEPIKEKIQKILEETVNTQLAAHNGSVSLSALTDGVAWVRFHGACANCMSASETLEDVVKEAILQAVPEVKDVRLDDTVSEELLDMARKLLNHELG